jgi:UDP-glucose 4-epimerase
MNFSKYIIVGGAGFIGSHFTDVLLSIPNIEKVTIYDNFSSGREWHYQHHLNDSRLNVIRGEVGDILNLTAAMTGHDVVIHLASNPDIAKAAIQPDIDFWQGTALTNYVVEAMRRSGTQRLLYASGSGVYGDLGEEEVQEDRGKLSPISTYGASKLAGEVLINSYCYMFGLSACAFRFGNVVGPRQTHGIGFDFTKKLVNNPKELSILGDGTQSKSYIYVDDVVRAVLMANEKLNKEFEIYNVATGDYITVKEIAELAANCLNISGVNFKYGTNNRGWKGDVPIIRLNTDKIKSLGWRCFLSTRQALERSIITMLPDIKNGRIQ